MTIRSIKICHLKSNSALKALDVHLAKRSASKGRELGWQDSLCGETAPLWPCHTCCAMSLSGWKIKYIISIYKTKEHARLNY